MEAIVVYITISNEEEAVRIAHTLVKERLCACVNILPSVRSIYTWQGKIEDEQELLMILKTTRGCFEKLCAQVKEMHSYTVPEIIAMPIIAGSEDYLSWLKSSVALSGD